MTIAAWSSGKSMSDSPYRNPADFSTIEPTHCLFCGAERNAHGDCAGCGAIIPPPSNDESLGTGYPCPRCKQMLVPTSFGRATIKRCEKCHGFFVPSMQFSMVVNDYVGGVELPLGALLPPLPPGKDIDRIPTVKCVACDKEMDRVNFASRSDAIIDVCTTHGIWLDPGELVPMLHFVKTRADLGEVPLSEEERQELVQMALARDASLDRMHYANVAALVIAATMRRGY
jgi:Zn-finger nucleic acid-binding protein